MNIAIIAPSPIPFVWGGAENLYSGLQEFINSETDHNCELIKVPIIEQSSLDLLNAYHKCATLDLKYFDRVISTKYPSWAVEHSKHSIYMLHKLRGLYDTYNFLGLSTYDEERDLTAEKLFSSIRSKLGNKRISQSELVEFIHNVSSLIQQPSNFGREQFPGPLIREAIHLLDSMCMQNLRIDRYAAISKNIKSRNNYFPSFADVLTLYPPPRIQCFRPGADEYFFTVSRLDRPKRIDIIIEAMKSVKANIPLIIAGIGPDYDRLKHLASKDTRIIFVGNVNDEELVEYYSNALAVPFIPYDEDYGYITVESMMSETPVITATDSGGPTEFVFHMQTGLITEPTPIDLGRSLQFACDNRDLMRNLGREAKKKVDSIRWDTVASGLLGVSLEKNRNRFLKSEELIQVPKVKPKIVITSTFKLFPVRGGGQSRIFNLYRSMSKWFEIEVVCFGSTTDDLIRHEIAPGMFETVIPKSQEHHDAELELSKQVDWIVVTDIAMNTLAALTPSYSKALVSACEGAVAVVASHPYLISTITENVPNLPIWFEIHNVEADLKKQIIPDTQAGKKLLDMVCESEMLAWKRSEVVFACTQTDIDRMKVLYGDISAASFEVPNGVCINSSKFYDTREKYLLREKLGLASNKSVVFMGSWHQPNIDAMQKIIELAPHFPGVQFYLLGSAGLALGSNNFPVNIKVLGELEEDVKNIVLAVADIALNPMSSGSGSNLKMLEYFALGVPVISTKFGARGLQIKHGQEYIECENEHLFSALCHALSAQSSTEKISEQARYLVEKVYDWDIIAERFINNLQSIKAKITGVM
jgi:glycosyltransferase involved in cell wall biosynthesis